MVEEIRKDFSLILSIIKEGSKILDVGCGNGELIELLNAHKKADARGIEITQNDVRQAVKKGLAVIQGDADNDLIHYPDKSFDYVISSRTLQATKDPKKVLQELLRIGNNVIISVPNFGHWYNRLYLSINGRMPVSKKMSYEWYETPNIHFCTIKDFEQLCKDIDANIESKLYISDIPFSPNLFASLGIFLINK